jgi:hypothetical protein
MTIAEVVESKQLHFYLAIQMTIAEAAESKQLHFYLAIQMTIAEVVELQPVKFSPQVSVPEILSKVGDISTDNPQFRQIDASEVDTDAGKSYLKLKQKDCILVLIPSS